MALCYEDLLYVSNFKGGNASIGDPRETVEQLLIAYANKLREINQNWGNQALGQLDQGQVHSLSDQLCSFIEMTEAPDTKITGFGVSWATALLALQFPDLAPIMDRRVLKQLKLDPIQTYKSAGRLAYNSDLYRKLLVRMHQELKSKGKSLREMDKFLFSQPM